MEKYNASTNKSFGIVFFLFFVIVSIFPLFKNGDIRVWSLIVAIIFLILGLLNSRVLTPFNILWFKFGLFLGKIVSPIIMGLIFFLVVTPTGIIMRLFNKDLLNLKKKKTKTYWIIRDNPDTDMKDQF
ncbi:SxtJ family membrane protein [Candidatus Pelagibacter bacterium]|nr:SxtJ family membrane protein [Candidatus Pelagibacter bacterium]MDA8835165.1 SxtJ family membrane protein [Candidatus Pelagibacter bacterium]